VVESDARPKIDVRGVDVDGQAVVTVRGEVDLAAVDELRECIERFRDGGRPLVLDLAGVTFMDSTGINTLIWAHQLQDRGQEAVVVVQNPSDPVRRVLALSGLNGVFRIEPAAEGTPEPDHAASRPRSSSQDRG